jgi:hypothetical protein
MSMRCRMSAVAMGCRHRASRGDEGRETAEDFGCTTRNGQQRTPAVSTSCRHNLRTGSVVITEREIVVFLVCSCEQTRPYMKPRHCAPFTSLPQAALPVICLSMPSLPEARADAGVMQ